MFKYILYITFFFLLISFQLQGQDHDMQFKHLSTQEGLSNYTVLSITQDHLGFMWFGTMDGLNRYDGTNVKVYREDEKESKSLGSSYIWSLLCNSDTGIWVGTNKGLYFYNYSEDNFRYCGTKKEENLSVRDLLLEGDQLFVATDKGLLIYDTQSQSFLNDGEILIGGLVHVLARTVDGSILLGGTKGLFSYQNGDIVPIISTFKGVPMNVRSIFVDKQNRYWIGTENLEHGAIIVDNHLGSITELSKKINKLPHNQVRTIIEMEDGTIWLGTREGIAIVDPSTLEGHFLDHDPYNQKSLSHNSIRRIYQDRSGIIWCGTYSGGVNYCRPSNKKILHYAYDPKNPNSLNYNIISAIYKDSQNRLWLGTENRGVNILDLEKNSYSTLQFEDENPNSLVHNNIKAFIEDRYGRMFIATNLGLSIYDPKTNDFFNIRTGKTSKGYLNSITVHDLSKDNFGNIWIGVTGGEKEYFHMYDITKDTIFQYSPGPNDLTNNKRLTVNTLVFDEQRNILWAGGEMGLSGINTVTKQPVILEEFLKSEKVLSGKIINDLQIDASGVLWIATFSHGLYAMDLSNYKIRKFDKEDGVNESSFYSMVLDDDKNLWISANAHLAKIYPLKNLDERPIKVEKMNEQEGFPIQQYYRNSAYKDENGLLYFGGDKGFISFNPLNINNYVFHPKVSITKIQVNGEPITKEDSIDINPITLERLTLKHNQSTVSMQFVAPNFLNSENTWYSYYVKGIHDKWHSLDKSNTINFPKLSPGKYEINLKASSDPTFYGNEHNTFYLTILPSFWETPLAFTIYGIVVLILLYVFIYTVRRWERMSQNLKFEHLEREKEHEFHEKRVRFFTDISHELRTPLTLIMGPLENIISSHPKDTKLQNQLLLMLKNGERMLNLVNQLLDLGKLETGHLTLKIAKENISRFVKEISASFHELAKSKNISIEVCDKDENVSCWLDRDKFEIILYNLFSNALKYTPEYGKIKVEISYQNKNIDNDNTSPQISLRITNSGYGIQEEKLKFIFDRFYNIQSTEHKNTYSSGLGLDIVKKLVELHKGTISVNSKFDENGVNGYVCFTINMNSGKEHYETEKVIVQGEDESSDETTTSISNVNNILSDDKINKSNGKPVILVVEDNLEVRNLLKDVFHPLYTIIEADNGNSGYKQATEHLPDLVISDIMMPGIDGIELCKKLKTESRTSHIPIILLTAKTAITFKYEGLETGADDYVVKPFGVEDLKLRVKNLIQQRSKLKEIYGKSKNMLLEKAKLSSVDERLLTNVKKYIDEHMADVDLTIEKVSQNVGISRVQLYRKIKTLTGLSPADYIKKIRMDYAAQLLDTNKFNVSEVRNMVGMPDEKNFRQCFKSHFKINPKEYQEQSKTVF